LGAGSEETADPDGDPAGTGMANLPLWYFKTCVFRFWSGETVACVAGVQDGAVLGVGDGMGFMREGR
jgi:hypothetical protein